MIAVCTNANCSEKDLPKDASELNPLPNEIFCGACGRPCAIRDGSDTKTPAP